MLCLAGPLSASLAPAFSLSQPVEGAKTGQGATEVDGSLEGFSDEVS